MLTLLPAVPAYENYGRWEGATETVLIQKPNEFVYETQSGDYDHVLPSINFNIEPIEDFIVRAAFSQTIGRAWYGNLQGGTTVGTQYNRGGASGSSGNPALLPLESTNLDLSFEYYYDEGSYVSLAWFDKKVKNGISTVVETRNTPEIYDPMNGPKVDEARAATGSNADDIVRQWIFDNYEDGSTVFMEDGKIIILGVPNVDDILDINVSIPSNSSEEQGYDGLELTLQHLFGDSGFGVIANYTMVDTDNTFDNASLDPQQAELGISDTANFVAFYDNHGFQARIAYNWRDEFLVSTGNDTGPNPRYTEAYQQIDFNVSYDIPSVEGLAVFVEGINITNEYSRQHGRSVTEVLNVTEYGARYLLGARYTF